MHNFSTNKEEIYNLLSENIFLNIYSIGDLDDFFWKSSKYLINQHDHSVVLIYQDKTFPVVLALNDSSIKPEFIPEKFREQFPSQFYAHFTGDYIHIFKTWCELKSHGLYYKMGLMKKDFNTNIDTSKAEILTNEDYKSLQIFYDKNYPENWFNERMLETNKFFAIRENGTIISVSGIHVYSEEYKVAAIASISTDKDYRGKGLAKQTIAKQCSELFKTVDHIGLNVKSENKNAIKCYENLGFRIIAEYEEMNCIKS